MLQDLCVWKEGFGFERNMIKIKPLTINKKVKHKQIRTRGDLTERRIANVLGILLKDLCRRTLEAS